MISHKTAMRWYLKLKHQIFTVIVLSISIVIGLVSCNQANYITPPTQNIGATLNTTAIEQEPRFSYDGRYLVFTSDRYSPWLPQDRNSKRSIYLYDLQSRRLLSLPGLNQPGSMQSQADISADGRYIVYVSEQLGKPDIFLYDRLSLKSEQITSNFLGEVRNPTISGNGRFIAFEGNRSGQWDLQIYDRGLGTELSLPGNFPTDFDSPQQNN